MKQFQVVIIENEGLETSDEHQKQKKNHQKVRGYAFKVDILRKYSYTKTSEQYKWSLTKFLVIMSLMLSHDAKQLFNNIINIQILLHKVYKLHRRD